MRTLPHLVGITIALSLVACSGDQGPTGPEGPEGPAGPEGPQGPEGNANVVADTTRLADGDWLWNQLYTLETSPGGSTSWFTRYVDLDVPAITQDILFAGDVRVYMRQASESRWVSFPVDFMAFGSEYMIRYRYEVLEGIIRLHYFHTPNSSDVTAPSAQDQTLPTRLYRWVVIEGSLAAEMSAAGVDPSVYEEVKRFFDTRGLEMESGTFRPPTGGR